MKQILHNKDYINIKINNKLTIDEDKYYKLIEDYFKSNKYNTMFHTKFVANTLSTINQNKLEQLAKHYNITTTGMLDKLINEAYKQVPQLKPVTVNKHKQLVIPDNVLSYRQLEDYLLANYTNEGTIVFKQDNYDYIVRTSNFKGSFSWKEYFDTICPKAKIVFVD